MSQLRFKLGDKVTITGQVVKQRKNYGDITYVDTAVPHRPAWRHKKDEDGNTVMRSYGFTSLPEWEDAHKPITEGVIVGKRTLQNGEYFWEEGYAIYTPKRGETHSVWLVSVAMDLKPIYCRDEQVTLNG